jgi:hypothetical protein
MWKIINEFPDYMINEYGVIYKVHGKKKNRIMQPKIDKDGYYHIGLRNEHGRFFKRVHRLVAETFIPNYNDEFDIVNHIDGNKQNNHFTNLEWCDVQYNTAYTFQVLGREGEHTTDIPCSLYENDTLISNFDCIKDACLYASEHFNASYSSLYKYNKSKQYTIIKH